MNSKKRILVTGAEGFIGSAVVAALRAMGIDVTGCDVVARVPGTFAIDLLSCKPQEISQLIDGHDAVIHLAAIVDLQAARGHEVITHNVGMATSVIEAVRLTEKQPLVFYLSTARVYAHTRQARVNEEERAVPVDPYTASKLMGEEALISYSLNYGMPYVIFRADSAFGQGQPRRMFISDVIQKMLEADEVHTGNLEAHKNFIYVHDLAHAIVQAVFSESDEARNTIFNISGTYASLAHILEICRGYIEERTGRRIRLYEDKAVFRSAGVSGKGFEVSDDRARRILGWAPQFTLEDGLKQTVDWFFSSRD